MSNCSARIDTPLGPLLCRLNANNALVELKLMHQEAGPADAAAEDDAIAGVRKQLAEYFAGRRNRFSIALAPAGTDFQQRVWQELLRIPYGETITYTELAVRLGDAKAVRAVGRANGANPIWIIIPCHRVVGADGSLTGYAGGIEVKRYLLELEGARQATLFGMAAGMDSAD